MLHTLEVLWEMLNGCSSIKWIFKILFTYLSGLCLSINVCYYQLCLAPSFVVYLPLCSAGCWCNTPQPGPYKAPVVDGKKTSTLCLPSWTVSSHHRATDRLRRTLDSRCTAKHLLSAPWEVNVFDLFLKRRYIEKKENKKSKCFTFFLFAK